MMQMAGEMAAPAPFDVDDFDREADSDPVVRAVAAALEPALAWILHAFEGVAACEIAKVPVLQGQ